MSPNPPRLTACSPRQPKPPLLLLRATLERQGTPMGANDLLIAAQALAIGATVVSADAAFARVPSLQVSNWLA